MFIQPRESKWDKFKHYLPIAGYLVSSAPLFYLLSLSSNDPNKPLTNPLTMMFLTELIKCAIFFGFLKFKDPKWMSARPYLTSAKILEYAIPSGLTGIHFILSIVFLSTISPSLLSFFGHFKILFAASFCTFVLSRPSSRLMWVAIGIVFCSAVILGYSHLPADYDASLTTPSLPSYTPLHDELDIVSNNLPIPLSTSDISSSSSSSSVSSGLEPANQVISSPSPPPPPPSTATTAPTTQDKQPTPPSSSSSTFTVKDKTSRSHRIMPIILSLISAFIISLITVSTEVILHQQKQSSSSSSSTATTTAVPILVSLCILSVWSTILPIVLSILLPLLLPSFIQIFPSLFSNVFSIYTLCILILSIIHSICIPFILSTYDSIILLSLSSVITWMPLLHQVRPGISIIFIPLLIIGIYLYRLQSNVLSLSHRPIMYSRVTQISGPMDIHDDLFTGLPLDITTATTATHGNTGVSSSRHNNHNNHNPLSDPFDHTYNGIHSVSLSDLELDDIISDDEF